MDKQQKTELIQEIKYSSIPRPSQEILLGLVEKYLLNTNSTNKVQGTYTEEGRQCPNCGNYDTKVVDNRYFKKHNEHLRKRKCKECGNKWFTEEVVVQEI